jgi:hypothetical protein
MPKTLDLGTRVELQSLDKHCQDISVALYQRVVDGQAQYLVHTYADHDEARLRVAYLRSVLQSRLGMQTLVDDPQWVAFTCKAEHLRAIQRAFLDLTKLAGDENIDPLALTVFDKKADCAITATGDGQGGYVITAEKESGTKRVNAVARGYIKLCEMEPVEGKEGTIKFACGTDHDAMIGQLMYRAQNVRAAMAEQEQAASQGVLSAPSAQE